jgi:hypothetical protein
VITNSLAIYAHYFAAFVLLVDVATALAVKRRETFARRWLLIAGAVFVACVPEALAASTTSNAGLSWIPTPSAAAPVNFFGMLSGGVLAAIVLGGLGCCAGLGAFSSTPAIGDARWQTGFVAALLFVPIVLSFAASFIGPIFYPRYLIVTLPALVVIAAAGLVRVPNRIVAVVVGLAVVGLSVRALAEWYAQPAREDNRGVASYIVGHTHPGDGYLTFPDYAALRCRCCTTWTGSRLRHPARSRSVRSATAWRGRRGSGSWYANSTSIASRAWRARQSARSRGTTRE